MARIPRTLNMLSCIAPFTKSIVMRCLTTLSWNVWKATHHFKRDNFTYMHSTTPSKSHVAPQTRHNVNITGSCKTQNSKLFIWPYTFILFYNYIIQYNSVQFMIVCFFPFGQGDSYYGQMRPLSWEPPFMGSCKSEKI